MKLHNITLTNFRSFKGEQTFRFPDAPGLYFMQGSNEAEPRLQANGSGKSTIWEALLWCLYGKTSKGLKAGDVCNWDAGKGAKVKLAFSTDGAVSLQVMTRTWSPNSWSLIDLFGNKTDLAKDSANPVLAGLMLEFTPFLHSILMAQSQPMFLDLKHDAQAALFSEVMGLDQWIDLSAKASKKASDQDRITRMIEQELFATTGRIEGQKDYQGSVQEFEVKRNDRLYYIEVKYAQVLARQKEIAAIVKTQEQDEEAVREVLRADAKAVDDWKPSEAATKCRQLDREIVAAESKIKTIESDIHFLDTHEHCPVCDQDITEKTRELKISQRETTVSNLRYDIEELILDLVKAQKVLKEEDLALKNLTEAKQRSQDDLRLCENALKESRRGVQMMDKELDELERHVVEITGEANPFINMQQEAQDEGRRLRSALVDIRARLALSEERQSLFSFWVKGFKDLRLNLIAEALTELEIEVNSCVTALGLVDWELRFQIDRETKGGSIQRGFNVQVLSPANSKATPWEAWSGGESQRLRLAATMGLSNLIRARSGVNLDLEVWDEPSQALSPQGVTDLLEALERRAQVEQRQIWVVDHTAHAFGGFAGGCMITKTLKGSQINQY